MGALGAAGGPMAVSRAMAVPLAFAPAGRWFLGFAERALGLTAPLSGAIAVCGPHAPRVHGSAQHGNVNDLQIDAIAKGDNVPRSGRNDAKGIVVDLPVIVAEVFEPDEHVDERRVELNEQSRTDHSGYSPDNALADAVFHHDGAVEIGHPSPHLHQPPDWAHRR